MTYCPEYTEPDGLPGDPGPIEVEKLRLMSSHAADSLDDVFVNGNEVLLIRRGELAGVARLDLMGALGFEA